MPDPTQTTEDAHARNLARIHELTTRLLDVGDMSIFLQRVAESVSDLFGFERASISIVDEARGVFSDHALVGYSAEEEAEIRANEEAFTKSIILADFREDCKVATTAYYIPVEKQASSADDFVAVKDAGAARRPRASKDSWHELDLLYFALHGRKGEFIGYMQVDYPKDRMIPSLDTIREIELFAGIAAVGIENSKVFKRVSDLLVENEAKAENLLKLLDLTRSILRVEDLGVILEKVATSMVDSFGYRKSGVALFSEGSNEVTTLALAGYTHEEQAAIRKGRILKEVVLADFKEEFRVTPTGYFVPGETQIDLIDQFTFIENRRSAVAPRKSPDAWHELDLLYFALYNREGKMTGYLQMDYPLSGRIPTKDMMQAMEAYSTVASIAIDNSIMFREMSDARSEVKMYLDLLTHDVGNFINPVTAYVELVLGTTRVTPLQYKYLSSALESTKSISHLIRNVRRSAQMLDQQTSEVVPKDLGKSLGLVVAEARAVFLSKKIDVRMKLPEGDVWVMADDLLEEVFYNLVSNSIKYDEHDEVVIDLVVDVTEFEGKHYARVRVVDRGVGIPDDLKQMAFTRGFREMHRMERPSLQKAKGAGMGLSLVKSLVERYGGKIWLENRVYGDHSMGSVFVVILPLP